MRSVILAVVAAAALAALPASAQPPGPYAPPEMASFMLPHFQANLTIPAQSAPFGIQWRTLDAKIVETKPSKDSPRDVKSAYDISPHAGGLDFDDSNWTAIGPEGLAVHRGGGHVGFTWYRTKITIPAKVGDFDPTGAQVVLTVQVDDYAEVWINGKLPGMTGHPSPGGIQGWNIPNRVIIDDNAKPGDTIQVAIFGINGPMSVAPDNAIFFRQAWLQFYKRGIPPTDPPHP